MGNFWRDFALNYLIPKELKESFKIANTHPGPPNPGCKLPPGVVIPDYREYIVDKNTPELLEVQKRLAARGLKDPWLRTLVWRYQKKHVGTKGARFRVVFLAGVRTAIPLLIITWIYENYYKKDDDHHHHGHHA